MRIAGLSIGEELGRADVLAARCAHEASIVNANKLGRSRIALEARVWLLGSNDAFASGTLKRCCRTAAAVLVTCGAHARAVRFGDVLAAVGELASAHAARERRVELERLHAPLVVALLAHDLAALERYVATMNDALLAYLH